MFVVMQMICQVYRSLKKDGMFLYVEKSKALSLVPEVLLQLFGAHKDVMVLLLKDEDKAVAGVTVQEIHQAIADKGFYLQLPPVLDSEMREMAEKNSKLQR